MAARDPDAASAERLILDHLPDIATLCNRMFVQLGDAQDATNEAVLAILRSLPSYRGEGPVRHWVLKVALNAARNHRRKLTTRRETPLTEQEVPRAMSDDPAESREERERLRSAIARLPEQLKEAVTLWYFHGLTQIEIAACVGCSQKTVSQRIKKALQQLNRGLGGGGAMGALAVAPVAGQVSLDAVSPALVTAVKQTIAGYYASGAVAATATMTQAVVGDTLATTGIATGGVVMKAKIAVGIAALAVSCLIGGAILSDQVLGSDREEQHAVEVEGLRGQIDTRTKELEAAQADLANEKRRAAARVSELNTKLELLRGEMDEKDRSLAALRDEVNGLRTGDTAGGGKELSRTERWKQLQETIAGVIAIMRKMEEPGANQFELGPQMVAELGRLSTEDFDALMAFDADETDPQIVGMIQAVVLQALIFVPGVSDQRHAYMDRFLDRAQEGGYDQALRRISFSMPPFVDAYDKIVRRMDDDNRKKVFDMAVDRAAGGATESMRMDGVVFLGRADEPGATTALMDVFGQAANSQRLRLAALKGLSSRANEDVLRLLRDTQRTESDAEFVTQIGSAADRVEALLAAKK